MTNSGALRASDHSAPYGRRGIRRDRTQIAAVTLLRGHKPPKAITCHQNATVIEYFPSQEEREEYDAANKYRKIL